LIDAGHDVIGTHNSPAIAELLADEYDLLDVDGSRPDCWGYIETYGIEEQSGEDVERFR
jgi:hypothetical protein